MRVGKNSVVTIDYTLKDADGQIIDTSVGKQSLPYMHGTGQLITGLEKALEGKSAGDHIEVSVPPEEAYGTRNEKMVQAVPRSAFPGVAAIKVGDQFRTQGAGGGEGGGGGMQVVTVTKIDAEQVTVDANHPLAGITLHFDVTIKDVRAATKEEIAHGHVHGPGGHHHH